jgi:hypothetical protein
MTHQSTCRIFLNRAEYMMTIFRNKNLGFSPLSTTVVCNVFFYGYAKPRKTKDTNREHYTYIPKLLCDMHALQLGMYDLLE